MARLRSALYAAVCLTTSIVVAPALAQDAPVTLRLAHWLPPAHPLYPAFEAWGASLKAATNGSITITQFPSEQLGKAFDGYDLARDGIADISLANPGYQPGRFPLSAASELPFTISDGKRGTTAVDEWYRKYAAKEMKDVHFCVAFMRANAYFQSRSKPIVTPADVKGARIRPSDGTIANLVTLLGGTNVFPWGSTILFGIDKVLKYHLDMPTEMGFFTLVINQAKYDGLSANQRKALDAHCTTDWANKINDPWVDFEEAGLAKIAAEPGHEVIKPKPEQVQAWKDAAKPLTEQWAKETAKAGFDSTTALNELNAALAAHNAKF